MKLHTSVILMFSLMVAAIAATTYIHAPSFTEKLESIRPVSCDVSDEFSSEGSGTVIAEDRVLTAFHVVRQARSPCVFNGEHTTKLIYANADEDLAVIEVETHDLKPIPIDCSGIRNGVQYQGFGYPGFIQAENRKVRLIKTGEFPNIDYQVEIEEGPPVLASTPLVANGGYRTFKKTEEYPFTSHDLRMMEGNVYVGMSGGPVISRKGKINGSINAIMGSAAAIRDLRDTNLCR